MADKLVGEGTWTAFTKKNKLDLDDAALIKALAAFDKCDEAKPRPRAAALEEVMAQLKKQLAAITKRKKELGDKPFAEAKNKLDDMLADAQALHKQIAKQAAEAVEDDAEESSPALLSSKMVPLLRELKKGESRMHALVCTAGRNTAVLVMRRPISPARRKLLAEAVDAAGGAKYLVGECLLENGVLTFVMLAQVGGLAKRLSAAILQQTGLRMRVRVRGEGGEEEVDGDDEAPAAVGAAQAAQVEPSAPSAAEAPATVPPSAEALRFTQRRDALLPRLEEAYRAGHAQATKLRALSGFASEKAEQQGDFAAAHKALDMVEQLLPAAPATAPAAAPAAAADAPRGVAPAIVYTQSRLAWVATRGKVKAELDKLERSILEHYAGHDALPEVVRSVRKLDRVLQMFDESLADQLDRALNTADADEKARCHDAARQAIDRYQSYLANDPLVQGVDNNPFVPVAVRATLSTTLKTLAAKIT